ncbi:hypothetical protein MCC02031_16870 [Bifidobacteriaceae bacterium MCC02031]|nr:hypothetical protein MCC02031_16870 [Bifidobacteriaceae bacterium MCC02031]GDZ40698.1 hypothetical protein MCC01970_14210 [Bifidobacteriaceae bacterium MCC01970]
MHDLPYLTDSTFRSPEMDNDCAPDRPPETVTGPHLYPYRRVYMVPQVSGKVKTLTGGNGETDDHNGPPPKPATRECG